jgi:hypothetical protein
MRPNEATISLRGADKATFELALWTRSFCRYTRKVVDDTFALSATLVRAGELAGATLLLADVGRDVHAEEAVLNDVIRLDDDPSAN